MNRLYLRIIAALGYRVQEHLQSAKASLASAVAAATISAQRNPPDSLSQGLAIVATSELAASILSIICWASALLLGPSGP